jgi:hypothetical protein
MLTIDEGSELCECIADAIRKSRARDKFPSVIALRVFGTRDEIGFMSLCFGYYGTAGRNWDDPVLYDVGRWLRENYDEPPIC